MVNTEIRLITFFTAKDGEALYSQQKQDEERTARSYRNASVYAVHCKRIRDPGGEGK